LSGAYANALTASLAAENATVDIGTLDPVASVAAVVAPTVKFVIGSTQPAPTPQPMLTPTAPPTPAPTPAPTSAAPQQPAKTPPSGGAASSPSSSDSSSADVGTTTIIIVVVVFGGGNLLVTSGLALLMRNRSARVRPQLNGIPLTNF
jgi:hypothetical protein